MYETFISPATAQEMDAWSLKKQTVKSGWFDIDI